MMNKFYILIRNTLINMSFLLGPMLGLLAGKLLGGGVKKKKSTGKKKKSKKSKRKGGAVHPKYRTGGGRVVSRMDEKGRVKLIKLPPDFISTK